VSDATRRFDRGRKAKLYAQSRIEDYCVVDLVAKRVFVHRQPARGKYRQISEHRAGEVFALLALRSPNGQRPNPNDQ
jgi:Uma2 family endonuclease